MAVQEFGLMRLRMSDSWSSQGGAGKLGVCVIGIAFSIATLIQFKVAITGSFRRELYQNKLTNRWLRWVGMFFILIVLALRPPVSYSDCGPELLLVHGLGRVGFFARGLLFLLVAILMFRSAANDNDPTAKDNNHSITRKAVDDLQVRYDPISNISECKLTDFVYSSNGGAKQSSYCWGSDCYYMPCSPY